eukprot:gene15809-17403_t
MGDSLGMSTIDKHTGVVMTNICVISFVNLSFYPRNLNKSVDFSVLGKDGKSFKFPGERSHYELQDKDKAARYSHYIDGSMKNIGTKTFTDWIIQELHGNVPGDHNNRRPKQPTLFRTAANDRAKDGFSWKILDWKQGKYAGLDRKEFRCLCNAHDLESTQMEIEERNEAGERRRRTMLKLGEGDGLISKFYQLHFLQALHKYMLLEKEKNKLILKEEYDSKYLLLSQSSMVPANNFAIKFEEFEDVREEDGLTSKFKWVNVAQLC